MKILLKFIVKNLVEKKMRTLLVIFSIGVCAGLIFANEGFSRTMEKMFFDASERFGGNSDIIIETKNEMGAPDWIYPGWIDVEGLSKHQDDYTYKVSCIRKSGLFVPDIENMQYLTILGVDLQAFDEHNPIFLAAGEKTNFKGYQIIIGEAFAIRNNLQTGDMISLEFDRQSYDFVVEGISKPKGLFLREDADGGFGIIPKSVFEEIYKTQLANLVFIKVKDHSGLQEQFESLKSSFAGYEVRYAKDEGVLKAETNNYVMPFKISSISVILMSVFIIFTSFGLITLERIPMIGTLRSIGCTRRKMNRILIGESALFGILGGLIGCILGIGVLFYIKTLYFAGEAGVSEVPVVFGMREILKAVCAATLITVGSAMIPIWQTTKIPIKNIILNDIDKGVVKKDKRWVIGIVLFVLCLFLPPVLPFNLLGMILACVLATGALLGLIFVIPFAVDGVSKLMGKLPFLGYEVILGVRNVRDHKNLVNNIRLFATAIAIVGFMSSIFNTLSADLKKIYDIESRYDIRMTLFQDNETVLSTLKEITGVEKVAREYTLYGLKLPQQETFLNALYGIDGEDYFDTVSVDVDRAREAIASLNTGNHIILTSVLKSKFHLNLGDTLMISIDNQPIPYTITGFVDSNMGIGHIGFVSLENMEKITSQYDANFYIKGNQDPDTLKNNIKRVFTREILSIQTKKEMQAANKDKVDGIFNSINTYANIAMMVGIIGIINNIIASFLERRRNLAMYRCIGMSKKGLKRMLMTESIMIGVLGVILGLITVVVMSSSIPVIVSIFWGKVRVEYALSKYLILGFVGIVSMIMVSYIPVLKGDKLSIIESMKYE